MTLFHSANSFPRRHRQQAVQSAPSIDTSASVLSSSVVQEPVKLKTSSSVQILTGPPPMVPNYGPINPSAVRMQRARNTVKAFANSGSIETSASSANHQRITYTPPVAPPARKQQEEAKPSNDKIESRSDNSEVSSDNTKSSELESRADNIESRSDSSPVAIDFPTIAMNSFFGRIK